MFIDLAVTAMTRSFSLDITRYKTPATSSDLESTSLRLPSWVPNFSKKRALPGPAFDGLVTSRHRAKLTDAEAYTGWRRTLFPSRPSLSFEDRYGTKVLKATGICLTRVASVETTPGIPSKLTDPCDAPLPIDQQSRHSLWQQYIGEQYQAQMQSRYAQWTLQQPMSSTFQTEEPLDTSLPPDIARQAEAILLFHARIHSENTVCCPTAFKTTCTRASLRSALVQELDLVRSLRSRYLPRKATGDPLRGHYTGDSHRAMASLFQTALEAAEQRLTLELEDNSVNSDLKSILRDLSRFRGHISNKSTLRYITAAHLGSCISLLELPPGPCQWPTNGEIATEALGRVASCNRVLDDFLDFRMLETDAGHLGLVHSDSEVQPGDMIVLFRDTSSLKIMRRSLVDEAGERLFELVGDVYLHWPDLEPH